MFQIQHIQEQVKNAVQKALSMEHSRKAFNDSMRSSTEMNDYLIKSMHAASKKQAGTNTPITLR